MEVVAGIVLLIVGFFASRFVGTKQDSARKKELDEELSKLDFRKDVLQKSKEVNKRKIAEAHTGIIGMTDKQIEDFWNDR